MKLMFAIFIPLLGWVSGLSAAPPDLIAQGDRYDAQAKPEQALQCYLQAVETQPTNTDLLLKITRQYVYRMTDVLTEPERVAQGRSALQYAERALKLAPDEGDSYLAVAICWGKLSPFLETKEKVEASRVIKEYSEKAVQLDPQSDYAWHMLGRWHQAVAEMPPFVRTLARLVYGKLPEASNTESVRCFQKAISLKPDRLIHYVELGRTYAQMGKVEEARQQLTKGLRMPNREKDDPETKQRGEYTLTTLAMVNTSGKRK